MARPNILYIHSHDTGRYIQPYGHAIQTPNLQRLAEEGVLFRQAFSVAPTCSPSRAGLLTGQWAHCAGMLGLAHRGFAQMDYKQHIIHTLHQAGYESTLIGLQHVAKNDDEVGYDCVVKVESRAGEHVASAADAFLSNAPREPFFLSVGFYETHRHFEPAGPDEDPRYSLPPHPLPDTPRIRQDMADYKASARVLDSAMGRVLAALEINGLAKNTLVICTTDHGIGFPAMKATLTDHGIGVMLIMRGPGGFIGGRVCDAMVSHIDIFPTICELLEIDPPDWLQGRSIMPWVRGEVVEINDEVFAEVTFHAAYEPQRAVRTKRWKYIRRFEERGGPVLPNYTDCLSKTEWLEHGWRQRPEAMEHLYDLIFDPVESGNLAGDPAYADLLSEMRNKLDDWMRATDDPLLIGPAHAPRGAELNYPDDMSYTDPTFTVP